MNFNKFFFYLLLFFFILDLFFQFGYLLSFQEKMNLEKEDLSLVQFKIYFLFRFFLFCSVGFKMRMCFDCLLLKGTERKRKSRELMFDIYNSIEMMEVCFGVGF